MRLAESFRNDDVEAVADDFCGDKSEQDLGAEVPQPDHAVAVGKDDRVRSLHQDRVAQLRSVFP